MVIKMKQIFSLLSLLGASLITGHTQESSTLGQKKIYPYATKPVVIAKGVKFVIHRLLGSSSTIETPSDLIIILTHTNTESGKMNVLYSSGVFLQLTRRPTYQSRRIVGIAQDESRLYLAVWETERVFTASDGPPERGYKWVGRFRLIAFWKSDGTQIARGPLNEEDPLMNSDKEAQFEAPDENVGEGPLKVVSNGVAWDKKRFEFRGRQFIGQRVAP